MSAECGPLTAMPSAASSSMAGAMTSASSLPIRPPSPACGLSPATAMRGAAMPKSWASAAAVIRTVSMSRARVSARGTAESGMCTVVGTTLSSSATSIITGWGLLGAP